MFYIQGLKLWWCCFRYAFWYWQFAFRQNSIHGGAPIAQFYSSTKTCTSFGGCEIPNVYNNTSVDILISDIYNDVYTCTEIDALFETIVVSDCYNGTEVNSILANQSYKGSENIGISNNQLSVTFP